MSFSLKVSSGSFTLLSNFLSREASSGSVHKSVGFQSTTSCTQFSSAQIGGAPNVGFACMAYDSKLIALPSSTSDSLYTYMAQLVNRRGDTTIHSFGQHVLHLVTAPYSIFWKPTLSAEVTKAKHKQGNESRIFWWREAISAPDSLLLSLIHPPHHSPKSELGIATCYTMVCVRRGSLGNLEFGERIGISGIEGGRMNRDEHPKLQWNALRLGVGYLHCHSP
ncbi:hypothetical protein VNO77_08803 [Canavalia gladiata]|uniref:Uncharacterized protein n=1 Tax=Canavalia gladiata TaxID=3824 RepID=A0AAN9M9G5_CANGL